MNFKKYADNDYEAVCDFLIELNARDTSHINWSWTWKGNLELLCQRALSL